MDPKWGTRRAKVHPTGLQAPPTARSRRSRHFGNASYISPPAGSGISPTPKTWPRRPIRRAIQALQAGRVEKPASLPSFLFQTALHVCQRRYRSSGREVKALRRFGASSSESGPDDPLGSLLSEERRAEVRRALEQLGEEDREILTLTYAEALRTAEIARRLGTSEGNVRVRRHRALGRLATILGVTRGSGREP